MWKCLTDPTETSLFGIEEEFEYEPGYVGRRWIAREVHREHAPLLTAAPKLLDALKVALEFMERDRVDCYYNPSPEELQTVRSAIALAESL